MAKNEFKKVKAKGLSRKEWDGVRKRLEKMPAKVRYVELYNLLDKASGEIRREIVSFIRLTEQEMAGGGSLGGFVGGGVGPVHSDSLRTKFARSSKSQSDFEMLRTAQREEGGSELESMVAGVHIKKEGEVSPSGEIYAADKTYYGSEKYKGKAGKELRESSEYTGRDASEAGSGAEALAGAFGKDIVKEHSDVYGRRKKKEEE